LAVDTVIVKPLHFKGLGSVLQNNTFIQQLLLNYSKVTVKTLAMLQINAILSINQTISRFPQKYEAAQLIAKLIIRRNTFQQIIILE